MGGEGMGWEGQKLLSHLSLLLWLTTALPHVADLLVRVDVLLVKGLDLGVVVGQGGGGDVDDVLAEREKEKKEKEKVGEIGWEWGCEAKGAPAAPRPQSCRPPTLFSSPNSCTRAPA